MSEYKSEANRHGFDRKLCHAQFQVYVFEYFHEMQS